MGNSNAPPPPSNENEVTTAGQATKLSKGDTNDIKDTANENRLVLNPHTGKIEENTGGCPFANKAAAVGYAETNPPPPAVTSPPPAIRAEEQLVINPHTGKKDAHEGGCPYGGVPHVPPHSDHHPNDHPNTHAKKHEYDKSVEAASVRNEEEADKCPFAPAPSSEAYLATKVENEKKECPFKPVPGSRADVTANAEKEECPFKPVPGSRADKDTNKQSTDSIAEATDAISFPAASLPSEEVARHEHDMSQIPLEEWRLYCETTDRSKFYRFAGPAMNVEEFQAVALRKIHFDNADKTSSKSITLTYNGLERLQVDCVVDGIEDEQLRRASAGHCHMHAAAGAQLRASCVKLFSSVDNAIEPLVSKSYNLPCTFVFHVQVPAFKDGSVVEHNAALCALYLQCFEKADSMGLNTIALPCLGCGGKDYPTETHPLMIQRLALKFLRNTAKTLQNVVFSFTDEEMAFLYQMNFTSLMELTWFPEDL